MYFPIISPTPEIRIAEPVDPTNRVFLETPDRKLADQITHRRKSFEEIQDTGLVKLLGRN